MKPLLLHLTPLVFGTAMVAGAAEQRAFVPVSPAHALAVLPTTPIGWKLLRSEAESTFSDWHQTRATRVFEAPLDANGVSSGSVELTVTDTGAFAPALGAFADFQPMKVEGLEKALVGSVPVIRFADPQGGRALQALVNQRFIVEVSVRGLKDQEPDAWLKAFRFAAIPPQGALQSVRSPREVRLAFVDEIRPANNRSYAAAVTDPARIQKNLKSLPQLPDPSTGASGQ